MKVGVVSAIDMTISSYVNLVIRYALWDMCASESVLVTPLEGVSRYTRSVNQNWRYKSSLHHIIYTPEGVNLLRSVKSINPILIPNYA